VDAALRLVVVIPFGLVFGSFLTVVIERLPAGESLVRPRSRCPSCGVQLRNVDNVPVVSWLVLRGRCRACGSRISLLYPLIELSVAGLFAGVALAYDEGWIIGLLSPFLGLLVAITVIDWRHKIIPNRLMYPAYPIAAGYLVIARLAGAPIDLVDALIGCLAYGGGLLIVALIAPRGMGMGDVKLAGFVGLVLGSLGLQYVWVAAGAGILAGGVAAVAALVAGAGRKTGLPYGPWIALGAAISAFWGQELANAYLRLIGA
jgi:leader peptidase (prepilin peptidase)/N-methyltransferase